MSRGYRTYDANQRPRPASEGDSGMQISRASGGAAPVERTDRRPDRPTDRRPPELVERPVERQDLPLRELQHLLSSDRPQLLAHGGKAYHITARQVRALATIGAFRAVPTDDLMNRQLLTKSELTNLREQGLTTHRTVSLHGDTRTVVTLSNNARRALEAHRMPDVTDRPQSLHSGLVKPTELPHDAQLYALYEVAAAELTRDGGTIDRVQLDYELKRQYQQFLHVGNETARVQRTPTEIKQWAEEHGLLLQDGRVKFPTPAEDRDPDGDRGRELRDEYREFLKGTHDDGLPDRRTPEEIQAWAEQNDLAIIDGHVTFPDVRIEYTDVHGHSRVQDVELVTPNYSARSVAAKRGAGFQVYRNVSATRGPGTQLSRKGFTPRSNLFERLV